MQPIEKAWLRGVDLNHRPLGYEFNISFGSVLSVRKVQRLSNSWFRLFRVVLDSHVRNLFAIAARRCDAKFSVVATAFTDQHCREVYK